MSARLPQALIRKKRDGDKLTDEELRSFVAGAADGSIPDYQVAAMLMAIFFRGLDDAELAVWADAMLRSGDVLELGLDRPAVDKHSTGGVGDKISLPLAPAVAACGAAVPMVSGRGLGHTGGTLDKLESIPGFRVDLPVERFIAQVRDLGVCLIGQTDRIAPADRRLYALRDVTGTVESIPLIASSIMSKKLAEGIDYLVLDCKVGAGAFMRTVDDAKVLATAIRAIGKAAGVEVTVCLTDMNAPIGTTIGNAVEVRESIEILQGGGPADSRELTCVLGGEMLALTGLAADAPAGTEQIAKVLGDGSALEVFRRLVEAQGGDARVCDQPDEVLPQAQTVTPVLAAKSGVVSAIEGRAVGMAGLLLGAGRRIATDTIDPSAGIVLETVVGDRIEAGQPIARLLSTRASASDIEAAGKMLADAYHLSDDGQPLASRILEVLR